MMALININAVGLHNLKKNLKNVKRKEHLEIHTNDFFDINNDVYPKLDKKYLERFYMVSEIPVAPLKRIIRDAGAERVSDNAALFLRDLLQQNAEALAEKAVIMANVAGRKTVNDQDLKNALEYFK